MYECVHPCMHACMDGCVRVCDLSLILTSLFVDMIKLLIKHILQIMSPCYTSNISLPLLCIEAMIDTRYKCS